MRKLINSTYITLDGIIQNPQDWPSLGSVDDAGTRAQSDLLEHSDALLMGRRTYESFAPVWMSRTGVPLDDRMHDIRKYVVSTRLVDPAWNNSTVIATDPVGAVRALKREPGADIVQYGFGSVTRALLAAGLVDELRLWVHPFMLGTGTAEDLLYRAGTSGSFQLAGTHALPNGVIILTYAAHPTAT